MAFPFSEYPYVNFSEFNYDWIIKKTRELLDHYDQLDTDFAQLHDYVYNYFANLDVDDEINAKIDSMVADGTFGALVDGLIDEKYEEIRKQMAAMQTALQTNINTLQTTLNTGQRAQDQRLDTLDGRVDNIAANPPQTSTEVTDTRVNYEGITYTVAGDAVRGSDSELSGLIKLLGRSAGFEDLAAGVGWSNGVLNQGGGVDSSPNFVTSGFIPVTPGCGYTFETGAANTGYTLYVSEYNSAQAFLSPRASITAAHPRYYNPSANAAYIRVSVSYAIHNAGFYIHQTAGSVNDYRRRLDVIRALEDDFEFENLINYDTLQNAELNTTGGVNATQNFVTTDYIPVKQGVTHILYAPNGTGTYTLYRSTYDASKNFITRVSIAAEAPVRTYDPPAGVAFVRFTFSHNVFNAGFYFGRMYPRKKDLIDRYAADNVMIRRYIKKPFDLSNYDRFKEIVVKPYDYEIPSGKTGQGFAVYKNYVFQMCDSDHIIIYDTANGWEVVGSYGATIGHGNSAAFSNYEFYVDTDAFPLLYVSSIDGNVYVLRVTLSGASLIRTIYLDPAIYGYTPQLALNARQMSMSYVVGKTTDAAYYTVLKLHRVSVLTTNLTRISGNTYKPTIYEEMTDLTPTAPAGGLVLQGVKILNGFLYLVSGGTREDVKSCINVYDFTDERYPNLDKSAYITGFSAEMNDNELEDIDFIESPYGGYDILGYIRTIGYHKLIF